ncbi:hypothetical protein FEM48_Zijuj06G0027000 [Ziziphus jujuba var. spinosa]|uniref:Uncharacterized protein n=1 Tax=Ziziphus jujuba var. spinosa TaxID=714518 RepID=A0A978V6P5_ZIZJJ|nr:hypothetical protein FEM48_Zijuj06G0027000 [Ziziphus jujuba var. spinosa]
MGSCISKCIPRKHPHFQEEEFDHPHVQDKLVISQASTTPINIIPLSNKISPSPPSPSNSTTSSVSSFTCTTTTNTSSSSSTSSSGSSVISSKDRSFSNEFLWSCYKENPHIIRINSLKEATLSSLPVSKPREHLDSPPKPVLPSTFLKQSNQQKMNWSATPQKKRVRSSSPTLTRKKSFRKEPDQRLTSTTSYSLQSTRTLRSPSPSRRFSNGGVLITNAQRECHSKRMSCTCTVGNPKCILRNKENVRPASPNSNIINSSRGIGTYSRSGRDTGIPRIGSKIDEIAVGEALAPLHDHDIDSIPMEDIDNPLIALDCFIFL